MGLPRQQQQQQYVIGSTASATTTTISSYSHTHQHPTAHAFTQRRRMGSWPKVKPIRVKLITMDVTGTIVSFRGSLEDHYVGAAEKSGIDPILLARLTPTAITKAFGAAYKDCCEQYPCFGGEAMSSKDWWRICVANSFQNAGLPMDDHQQEMVFQRIYSTFGSHAAYESFADAKPFLQWARRHNLVTGIVSNADERYGDSILPMLDITLDEVQFTCFSKDYRMEKPDPRFFQAAIQKSLPWLISHQSSQQTQTQQYFKGSKTINRKNKTSAFSPGDVDTDKICHPSEVLHIGNDFTKDFEGARQAGMHCVLLDRYGEEEKAAEWKRRGAPVLKDLLDVVEFLGRSNCKLG